jgi:hypothetical protein
MTLRQSLARYVKGLLEEPSTPTTSRPPTSSPLSTPPTTTPSTTTSPVTSEAGVMQVVLETMERMQTQNLREIRGMVTDILQGRENDPGPMISRPAQVEPLMPFDPPNYDDPSLEDLPGGIQAVFERQEQEQHDVRRLRTEQEVLAYQLEEARGALMDPQGPDFMHSSLTD